MSALVAAGAAYRDAAGAYLRTEAARWAAQLRLDLAIREQADPATIRFRHEYVWATVAALCDATAALETAEAALRAAIPIPLPLEMFHD